MRLLRTAAIVYAAAILLPGAAAAQTPAPTPAETRAEPAAQQPRQQLDDASAAAPDEADLSITARVTARELLFRKVPNPRVEFPGRHERRTLWEAERENLPEQVQPGVTYRDIGIRLRITSVFADIDRIVAEALGEVPAREGTPTPPQPQPRQTPPAAPPAPAVPPERSARPALDPSPAPQTSPADAPTEATRRLARPRGARRGTRN